MEKKDFYTLPEVAAIKGCTRIAVFQAVQDGRLPAMKIGRQWVVRARDLDKYEPTRGPGGRSDG